MSGNAADAPDRGDAPIRLIALDLDGTVLDRNLNIHPSTVEALQQVLAGGWLVTIITGRMFVSARPYAAALGLGDVPLVAYNGALIRTAVTGQTLYHLPVEGETAIELAALVRDLGYTLNVYVDDRLIVPEINDKTRFYAAIAGVEAHPVGDLPSYLGAAGVAEDRRPTKMLVADDEPRIQVLRESVIKTFGARLYTVTSYPFFLEMMNPGVSKSAALGKLAARFGVDRREIMAIGDSYNDLDMLEYAGIGVAMGSAPDEVKARADHVTGTTDQGGVAAAIRRFVLEGRK